MKLKKFLGFGLAFAAASLATVAVQAATYKAVSKVSSDKSTVTMTVNVSEATQVNGYAVKLSYDPTVLKPVASETDDATGSTCYATTAVSDGVLVADLVDGDSSDTKAVAVGWAAADAVTVSSNGTDLATVKFEVLEQKDTTVGVDVVAYASDENTLVDTSDAEKVTAVAGDVTFTEAFLRGDANGDGVVNDKDATLVSQYVVKLETIDEGNMLKADANNDGEINDKDATLISQYVVKLDTISE